MLTPVDIQQKKFRTGLGFEKKDVLTFFEEVTESYEKLYRSNAELQEELTTLKDTLQNYKSKEASMEKSKLLAEKDSEDTKSRAIREAKTIELDAKNKAKNIVAEAEESLVKMQDEMTMLESRYAAYKTEFATLLKKQFEFLKENDYDVDSMIDERFAGMVFSGGGVAPASGSSSGGDFGTFSGDPQMRDESTLGGGMGGAGGGNPDNYKQSDSSVYTSNLGANENFVDPFNPDKKDNRFNPFDPATAKSKGTKTSFKVSDGSNSKNRRKPPNHTAKKPASNNTSQFKEAEIPTIKTN